MSSFILHALGTLYTQAISESIVVLRVHGNRFKYLLIVSEYLTHVSSYIHLSPENCSSIKNNTCAALQFLTLQDIVYIYIYTVYISILSVTFNKSNCGNFYLLAIMPGTLWTEVGTWLSEEGLIGPPNICLTFSGQSHNSILQIKTSSQSNFRRNSLRVFTFHFNIVVKNASRRWLHW